MTEKIVDHVHRIGQTESDSIRKLENQIIFLQEELNWYKQRFPVAWDLYTTNDEQFDVLINEKLLTPSYKIDTKFNMTYEEMLRKIEQDARICYQSQPKSYSLESSEQFVKRIMKHEGVLEHADISVFFNIERVEADSLLRHRMTSPLLESTRYCNYSKIGITFCKPHWWDENYDDLDSAENIILDTMLYCEKQYNRLIEKGLNPQDARWVLPLGTKAQLVIKANIREWRYILNLRTKPGCHPEMIKIMNSLLIDLQKLYPVLFSEMD